MLEGLRHNSFATMVRTWLRGEFVGSDELGNRYYRSKGGRDRRPERRWVVYAGPVEPSGVPAGWDGWLHGTIEHPPSERPLPAPRWEKQAPLVAKADAARAYYPPGSLRRPEPDRADARGREYEAWRP